MTDTVTQAAASVAGAVKSAESAVAADVSKVSTELSFVEANWGKLSVIVVAAGSLGFLAGWLL